MPLHFDSPVAVRPLAARDSMDVLTALLHRAYAPLVARGMNFTASAQTADVTRKRAAEGQCFVAEDAGEIVGTVTVCGPYDIESETWSVDAPWYRDPDTAHFHQFAVDPRHQGQGIGRRLVATCEQWARDRGYRWMALDTAVPASELQALYSRLGYAEIGQVQWPGKRYRTVAMRKTLHRSPLGEHLQTMARYNLWATRRLLDHVALLSEADYRRDMGLFFKSVHGTLNHLLVAEHLLWFPRFAQGQSNTHRLNEEAEPDRARLRERLLDGALAWPPQLDMWPDERLHGTLEYWRACGEHVVLPFAATLGHVFNHGTHHRGQITAALTMLGAPCPEIDLVPMLREENPSK